MSRWNRKTLAEALVLAAVAGCAPGLGTPATQVRVVHAPARHAVTSDGVIGTLTGGALGESGGSLIAVRLDKSDPRFRDQAVLAALNADTHPAITSDVAGSDSADVNRDGYVTMDEITALTHAGVTEDELIRRISRTNQIFELTEYQRSILRDDAVGERVIDAMLAMNRAAVSSNIAAATKPSAHEANLSPVNTSTER